MKGFLSIIGVALIAACGGSSTAPTAARFNFAIVAGKDQQVTASAASPDKTVTAMLTRDPNGTFATRVLDFLSPAIAFAQDITLSGTPVANQIVCGQQAKPGEPEIIPLCAFTLADGKAANHVKGGTKAGKYELPFTAQVATQIPVKDSTSFTVVPGPAIGAGGGQCSTGQLGCNLVSGGDVLDIHTMIPNAWDEFQNPIDVATKTPSYAVRAASCGYCINQANTTPSPTVPDASGWLVTVDPKFAGPPVYVGPVAEYPKVLVYVFVDGNVVYRWPIEVK
jgi:hypothetical protein